MNITPWYDLPPSTLGLSTLDNASENYLGFPAIIGSNAGGRDVYIGVNYLNQGETVSFNFFPLGESPSSAELANNGDAHPDNWDLDFIGSLWNDFGLEATVDTDVTPNLPALHITGNSISDPLPLPMVIVAYRKINNKRVLDNIMVLAESTEQLEDFLADVFIPLTVDGIGLGVFDGGQFLDISVSNVGRNRIASLGTIYEDGLVDANVYKSGKYGVILDNTEYGPIYEGTYPFEFV